MLSVVVRHVYLSFVQCIVTGTYCSYGVVCCYGMRTYGSYDGLCVVLPILLTLVSLKRELSQKSSHVLLFYIQNRAWFMFDPNFQKIYGTFGI